MLKTISIMGVLLFAGFAVYSQSGSQVQTSKVRQKAASQIKKAPVNVPERVPFRGSPEGYMMVTDVMDGLGGDSESDNYGNPVNSGGQPSAIGISESSNYVVKAGYVHASQVSRGDVNADGIVNLGDVVYLVSYLYQGGPEPRPPETGDINSDGAVNVGDVVYLVGYLYKGGPPPAC
jgi:hypothetical protein